MKTLLATAALVTLIASPVYAQTTPRQTTVQPNSQTMQVQQFGRTERHSTNPAHDVYDASGRYIGSDPDSKIRQSLINDRADGD